MVDTNKLRGVMAERQKTQAEVARAIGITPRTFSSRMKRGVFGSDEIEVMVKYLDIKEPAAIFFAQK